jgi:hypothetical protein
MPGTLGDCLPAAEWYFSAAEADGVPAPGQAETVHQAQRLVAGLGRYLDAMSAGDGPDTAALGGVRDAVAGMRAGLQAAGEHLKHPGLC